MNERELTLIDIWYPFTVPGMSFALSTIQGYIRGALFHARNMGREDPNSLDWVISQELERERLNQLQSSLRVLDELGLISNHSQWHVWTVVCKLANKYEEGSNND